MKYFKRPEWRRPQWVLAQTFHKLTLGLALLIAASALVPAHAAVQTLDHIVAIVNDEVSTSRGGSGVFCRDRFCATSV